MHTYIAESLVKQRVAALHAEAANRSLANCALAGQEPTSRRSVRSVLRLRRQAPAPRIACQG